PEALYSDPVNAYVARAIGSPPMNMLQGMSKAGILQADGIRIPLFSGAPEGDVMVGIRPEDIHPFGGERADTTTTAAFEARVQLIELLGARAIVTLLAGDQRLTAVFNLRDLAGIN